MVVVAEGDAGVVLGVDEVLEGVEALFLLLLLLLLLLLAA